MNALRFWPTAIVALWLAVVLNNGLAPHLSIGGIRPDFLLAVMCVLGLMTRPASAAWVGLVAGIMHAGIAGANLTHYAASRAIAAFGISLGRDTTFEAGPVFAAIAAVLGTLLAEGIFLLFAPPPNIGSFAQATIGTAIYNGVLAMPLFAVLRRLAIPDKVDL